MMFILDPLILIIIDFEHWVYIFHLLSSSLLNSSSYFPGFFLDAKIKNLRIISKFLKHLLSKYRHTNEVSISLKK